MTGKQGTRAWRMIGTVLYVPLLLVGCVAVAVGGAPSDPVTPGDPVSRAEPLALFGLGAVAAACGFFGLLALWRRLFHGPRARRSSRVTTVGAVVVGYAALAGVFAVAAALS